MTLGTVPRQRLTLAGACTAQVMMVLDVMFVSVASRVCRRASPLAHGHGMGGQRRCPGSGHRAGSAQSAVPGVLGPRPPRKATRWLGGRGSELAEGVPSGSWTPPWKVAGWGCGTAATGTAVRPRRWTAPCSGPGRRPHTNSEVRCSEATSTSVPSIGDLMECSYEDQMN
jgi:hypothetical protein